MAEPGHHLTMTVREGHLHRFGPSCSCGWVGVPLRSEASAKRAHTHHASIAGRRPKKSSPRHYAIPRPVTPDEKLPEALRRRT